VGRLADEVLEPFRLGDLEPAVLFAPAVVGDLVDAEGLDYLGDLLAFTEQNVGLAQLGDDLLGAVALLRLGLTPSYVICRNYSIRQGQSEVGKPRLQNPAGRVSRRVFQQPARAVCIFTGNSRPTP
jgi:hypothetical protein